MSIINSPGLHSTKEHCPNGEFYHGQTKIYYDEKGNYIRREYEQVLLWPTTNKELHKTFVSRIEIIVPTNDNQLDVENPTKKIRCV